MNKNSWGKLFIFLSCIFLLDATALAEVSEKEYQSKILHYINAYRTSHHLLPLKMSPIISSVAAVHSRNMASKKLSFGHQGFHGRIAHLYKGFKNCRGGAENVAYYRLNPKQLVNGWVASRGHRQNIEGHYNLTGIGIAYGKKGWAHFTQIFLLCER